MSDTLVLPALTATHPALGSLPGTTTLSRESEARSWTLGSLHAAIQLLDRLYDEGASECELVVLGPSTYVVRQPAPSPAGTDRCR